MCQINNGNQICYWIISSCRALEQFHPAIFDHTRINPLIIRSNMFVAKMLTM